MSDPAVDLASQQRFGPLKRSTVIVLALIPATLLVGYVLGYVTSYRNGYDVIGRSDMEACALITRTMGPVPDAEVWARRVIPADERERSRKASAKAVVGFVQTGSEEGSIEGIGTIAGRKRYRVMVSPGPFGIGWQMNRCESIRDPQ